LKNFPAESLKVVFGTSHKVKMFKGKGCRACRNSGYSGRVGLFEVLAVTKEIRKLITQKADSDIITKEAIAEGMRTMLQDGLDKINRGVTTIEEVLRVTKAEFMS
jgi:type II secretory ATPase GspE/PulE/Tfp pilus assembly ATPase PilB-like protein